ncbi:phosphatidate cytidylyltransferase [Fulvimarina sp. 2208YS6-2-32]|uniref:Phosphatidate cytidylyltransferase n=1 Tax=Fulvimarina uroteuthidis TaxID=3098149 RepID=A0ABU5I301_9HYPH|nr:phosphatidate cytidylyltransferase [Fulvimarina sp. 2208YS6-2-32]MDY8109732.1 phosphatidate cytidylyltransferase [Fulvimarina sp. 2208YS6-2-32]
MADLRNRLRAMKSWGDLKARFLSALLLAILVIALTILGGFPFRILCAAIGVIVFDEWSRMTRSSRRGGAIHPFAKRCLYLTLLLFVFGLNGLALGVLAAGMAFIAFVDRFEKRAYWTLGGLFYAAVASLPLGFLRSDDWTGLIALGFVTVVVWATDIFAYFTGRSLGGPKLMRSVSPNKTISGALGGLVAGVVFAGLYLAVFAPGFSLGLLFLASGLSVLGQIGDLFESWMKRRFGVKDSGRIIPGHGGVMDRIDALVFAVAAAYLVGAFNGAFFEPAQGLFAR